METSTMTLTEFLAMRIQEDERVVWVENQKHYIERYDFHGGTHGDLDNWTVNCRCGWEVPMPPAGIERDVVEVAHVGTHPVFDSRRRREVVAKRRIIELATLPQHQSFTSPWVDALLALAAVYADHSDYNAEWRP